MGSQRVRHDWVTFTSTSSSLAQLEPLSNNLADPWVPFKAEGEWDLVAPPGQFLHLRPPPPPPPPHPGRNTLAFGLHCPGGLVPITCGHGRGGTGFVLPERGSLSRPGGASLSASKDRDLPRELLPVCAKRFVNVVTGTQLAS